MSLVVFRAPINNKQVSENVRNEKFKKSSARLNHSLLRVFERYIELRLRLKHDEDVCPEGL